jgi:hypothetical protein
MDKEKLGKAVDRIEALLAKANEKCIAGQTHDVQNEINSARTILQLVKMLLAK